MKEHKKLGQKQVSKVILHFVWGHLSRKQTVDRLVEDGQGADPPGPTVVLEALKAYRNEFSKWVGHLRSLASEKISDASHASQNFQLWYPPIRKFWTIRKFWPVRNFWQPT